MIMNMITIIIINKHGKRCDSMTYYYIFDEWNVFKAQTK